MTEPRWPEAHREQVRLTTRIGGWLLLGVATWRFLRWGENPGMWDAGVTVLFFALGGAGAMPGAMARATSWIVDALPWTQSKGGGS